MKSNVSLKKSFLAATLVLGQAFCVPSLAVLAAGSDVRLAGQVVLANIAPAGSMTSQARSEQIQTSLDNALIAAKDRGPSSVNIAYVKGTPVLTVGGYHVATVDSASAKSAGTTPALLAKKWADTLRNALRDQESIDAYVSQMNGEYVASAPSTISSPAAQSQPVPSQTALNQPQDNSGYQQAYQQPTGYQPAYKQGRIVYAPAGLVLPATLSTSISADVAKAGDLVQAQLSQAVILGESQLPAGTMLIGQVTDATPGRMLGRSGQLSLKFNRMRTPDGQEIPITAHMMGGIDKFAEVGGDNADTFKGETWKGKVMQAGLRGAIGAGTGAALGTAVGAIAGGGRGVGKGAWSGTAIGAGVGMAQSLILRKGKSVVVGSGTAIQLQLDAPIQFSDSIATSLQPMAFNGN